MNKEFPNTKFGKLVLAQPKSNIKAGEGKTKGIFPFFTSSPVQTKYLDKYIYQGPAIIFGTGGGASVHACEGPFATSTDCLVYYPASKNVYIKYLYRYLLGNIHILQRGFKGAGLQHISKTYIENLDIPFPNIKEQESIVERLDKVQKLIALQREQLKKLDDLIKSRFIDLFGDPISNPKKWEPISLDEIADIRIGPFGSMLHCEDYIQDGYPLVNPSHITNNQINIDPNFTVSKDKYNELYQYHLAKGDVVMGRRGEMGRCAVVMSSNLLCGTGSLFIRPKEILLSEYIQKVLSFPTFKRMIESKSVGQTMPNLNISIVSSFIIPLPPQHIRKLYVNFLNQIEKQKGLLITRLTHLETLYKSLMQEYFG